MTSQVTTKQRGTSSSQLTVLSKLLYAQVRIDVWFETAWYPSAQNTMHVSPIEAPPQVELTPTTLCIKVSEPSICGHDGYTVCASLTNSPDERQRKEVVEIFPSTSTPLGERPPREQTTDKNQTPATSLYTHVKVPLVSFAAWHPSTKVTAQLSPMVQEAKSRWARGRQWSTSVLRKWDTEALQHAPGKSPIWFSWKTCSVIHVAGNVVRSARHCPRMDFQKSHRNPTRLSCQGSSQRTPAARTWGDRHQSKSRSSYKSTQPDLPP